MKGKEKAYKTRKHFSFRILFYKQIFNLTNTLKWKSSVKAKLHARQNLNVKMHFLNFIFIFLCRQKSYSKQKHNIRG
jgi:hypothetical protein